MTEDRWPAVCAAMTAEGLRSCLILPLRTDREPGGAIAIYGTEPRSFVGAGHDVALLFAAQGGVALRNAALYGNCRRMVENLQVALESRAVIEQAKGILVAEYGYPAGRGVQAAERAVAEHQQEGQGHRG